jgi:hypothetical protein
MEYTIHRYGDGETLTLTTDSVAAHYDIPALRYSGCPCPDMGPADRLCLHVEPQGAVDLFGGHTAAEMVDKWASLERPRLGPDGWEAARLFLAQWPDGPQLRAWTA